MITYRVLIPATAAEHASLRNNTVLCLPRSHLMQSLVELLLNLLCSLSYGTMHFGPRMAILRPTITVLSQPTIPWIGSIIVVPHLVLSVKFVDTKPHNLPQEWMVGAVWTGPTWNLQDGYKFLLWIL